MPLSDIPLSVQVVLFLTVFLLIGILPMIKKTMAKVRKLLDQAAKTGEPFAPQLENAHTEIFSTYPSSEPLNDFEIMVLRRIAQAGGKALSRKQVNEPLLFGDAVLSKTLKSLNRRRMVSVRISRLLGQRFVLNEAGRSFALEQGYIVLVRENTGLI